MPAILLIMLVENEGQADEDRVLTCKGETTPPLSIHTLWVVSPYSSESKCGILCTTHPVSLLSISPLYLLKRTKLFPLYTLHNLSHQGKFHLCGKLNTPGHFFGSIFYVPPPPYLSIPLSICRVFVPLSYLLSTYS